MNKNKLLEKQILSPLKIVFDLQICPKLNYNVTYII